MLLKIQQEGPGRLVLRGPALPAPIHLAEQEPWVYREVRGQEMLVLKGQDGREPEVAFLSSNPGAAYERTSVLMSPPVQWAIGALSALGILVAFFGYPVAMLRCKALHREVDIRVRAAHLGAWTAAAAFAAAIFAFAVLLQDPQQLVFGSPRSLTVAQWSARAGAVLTVFSAASAVILWARSFSRRGGRIAHTLAVLCQVVLALWAARWGLLG